MKLKNKLKIYESYLAGKNAPVAEKSTSSVEIPNRDEWEKRQVTPYILDGQYCLIREKRYPISMKRGKYRFADFLDAVSLWQNTGVAHPLSARDYSPYDLFFFDTETTGLSGGTGNIIFLLGYAYFERDQVVVKQHLLPEPGGEVPLYDSFLRSVDYTTLVTYNGRAFDWPQVKTRHTLIREHVPKLPSFGHFDLLHAARRLWKHRLESVKLSIVEKEILGIERHDDLPGHLVPMVYFDFVDTKNMEGILKVLEHNEEDVLSLIILYTHITDQLLGRAGGQTAEEKLSCGRWYASLKEGEMAVRFLEDAVRELEGRELWQGMFELANVYKKQNRLEKSIPLWQETVDSGRGNVKIQSCIELAKYFEHKQKDYRRAYNICLIAVDECSRIKKLRGNVPDLLFADINKRMSRLERKMEKF